jgi:hypothetical protein
VNQIVESFRACFGNRGEDPELKRVRDLERLRALIEKRDALKGECYELFMVEAEELMDGLRSELVARAGESIALRYAGGIEAMQAILGLRSAIESQINELQGQLNAKEGD